MSYNDQQNPDFDESAAQDAGYAAGAVEGGFDRADQDVRRDEQEVENIPEDVGRDAEQGFDRSVQDVEDVPQDIGNAVRGAADWIGDKIGGVEGDARRADQDVQNFDNQVDSSYDQGEQQGRQEGGW